VNASAWDLDNDTRDTAARRLKTGKHRRTQRITHTYPPQRQTIARVTSRVVFRSFCPTNQCTRVIAASLLSWRHFLQRHKPTATFIRWRQQHSVTMSCKNVAAYLLSQLWKMFMDFNNFYISGKSNECPLQLQVSHLHILVSFSNVCMRPEFMALMLMSCDSVCCLCGTAWSSRW